jgi:transposase-like protein
MDTPNCLKCGSTDHMVVEDSGATYVSWRCMECDKGRSQKNGLGKSIPFLGLALALIFGIPHDS